MAGAALITPPPYAAMFVRAYSSAWSVQRIAGSLESLYGLRYTNAQLAAWMDADGLTHRANDAADQGQVDVAVVPARVAAAVRRMRKPSARLLRSVYLTIKAARLKQLLQLERRERERDGELMAKQRSEIDKLATVGFKAHALELDNERCFRREAEASLRAAEQTIAELRMAPPPDDGGQAPAGLMGVVRRHLGTIDPGEVDRKIAALVSEVSQALYARMSNANATPETEVAIVDGKRMVRCIRCKEQFARKMGERICPACHEQAQRVALAKARPAPQDIRRKAAGINKACRRCHEVFFADPPNTRYCQACRESSAKSLADGANNCHCKGCGARFFAQPPRKYCDACREQGIGETRGATGKCHGCQQAFERKVGDGRRNFCYVCAPAVDLEAIARDQAAAAAIAEVAWNRREREREKPIPYREKPRCQENCRHAEPCASAYTGFMCLKNAAICQPFQAASLYERAP